MRNNICVIIIIIGFFTSCKLNIDGKSIGIDTRNEEFVEAKIGNQIWMKENLNVEEFRNGDPIPEAKTDDEWKSASDNKQPAWCYYLNDPENGKLYGKLYNWYALVDKRGLAPEGWHIPNDQEWTELVENLGGPAPACEKMKTEEGWLQDANGTNISGFSALPGGTRDIEGGFMMYTCNGCWWSTTQDDSLGAIARQISCVRDDILRAYEYKQNGLSVRCVKN